MRRWKRPQAIVAGSTNDAAAQWGQNHTVRVRGDRCAQCGGRLMQIRDHFKNEVATVCRGGCR